jgi:hypothetical protein
MTIRRMVTALVGCVVVLFAGISLAAGTAANAGELTCSTSVPVQLDEPGLWSYTFQVSWCVQDGRIVRIVPNVEHQVHSSACTWMGQSDESQTPAPGGSGAWEVFDMSKFLCETGEGGTQSVTPWGIITIHPDGTSTVMRKGIGDDIKE